MASIALERTDVVVGVGTHKDEHVAVALDGLGGHLGELFASTDRDGYARLVEWAGAFWKVNSFGAEGCGSYGSGLYQFLRRRNYSVTEVNRPARKGERRLLGKSDVIDAEHAAREVLAGRATTTPKSSNGSIEDARAFCEAFLAYPNHDHRHSGIGYHTPASIHYGTAKEVRSQRAATLGAAYAVNPTRFGGRMPHPPELPTVAWINDPNEEVTQKAS